MRADPVESPPIYLCGPGDSMSSSIWWSKATKGGVLGPCQLHTVGPQHWEAKPSSSLGHQMRSSSMWYWRRYRMHGTIVKFRVQGSRPWTSTSDSGADELIDATAAFNRPETAHRFAARARRAHRVIFQLGPHRGSRRPVGGHGSEQHRLTKTEIRLLEYLVQRRIGRAVTWNCFETYGGIPHPPRTRAVAGHTV